MKLRAGLVGLLLLTGCNPYSRWTGEYNAGPVDPAKFPAAYLGDGGDAKRGGGRFAPSTAYVDGSAIGYYGFPFSPAQLAADDPLALGIDGAPGAFATPPAYVFDPGAGSPFPAAPRCRAAAGYAYDEQRDGIHLDEQGNVFTALPADASYVPLVAEVPVQSNGELCQSIKSVETLLKSRRVSLPLAAPPEGSAPDALRSGLPDGKLLAWALVDPSAEVDFLDGNPDPTTHLGPQRFGWFDHYLTQYIDGGYVPTTTRMVPAQMDTPAMTITDLVTQTLFVPTLVPGEDANGAPVAEPTMGEPGHGHDVLQAARGTSGYSPVCRVMTFVPADPLNPPTSVAAIDMTTAMPAPTPFIYCLQVE